MSERLPLAALALELGIAAAIEGQFALVEMQDGVDRIVEKIAVVADDDDMVRGYFAR